MKFYCNHCEREFETNSPSKKEYRDYLLGSCWKYISYCPACGAESDEKRTPKPRKYYEPSPSQNYCNYGDCRNCGL